MILRLNQNGSRTTDSLGSWKEADSASTTLTPAEESHQLETEQLSTLVAYQPSAYPIMSATWVFETVSLDSIAEHADLQSGNRWRGKIFLPNYSDARMLFDNYVKHIRHYHHIVHIPTLRNHVLENFYLKISRREPVDTDHAALLLGIFASVVYYLSKMGDDPEQQQFQVEKDGPFMILFRYALDLVDHSRRVLPGSVEIVQTCIILLFLDYNLEGLTLRTRALLAQAVQTAKELGMHRLDSAAAITRRSGTMSIATMIDLEMKRRIWWHLAATDWATSMAGSAQEGTYIIIEQHTRVLQPRNVDDEALDRGNTTEDLPLTQPTSMSYPLQRIRLGQLSRDATDFMRFGISNPNEIDYDTVMLLDRRIQNFLDDLPLFLKVDSDSIKKSQYILERFPHFAMQRYICGMGAYSLRCKLHQPFLILAAARGKYAPSTEICLDSAMKVIEINKSIRQDPTHVIPTKLKFTGFLHHMFMATVVLVMDLCFNGKAEVSSSKAGEVIQAIQLMEEARDESVSVQKFLDMLTDLLRRHHIRLEDRGSINSVLSANSTCDAATQNGQKTTILNANIFNPANNVTSGYEDIWRNALQHGELSNLPALPQMPDWDQLFSEFDSFIA